MLACLRSNALSPQRIVGGGSRCSTPATPEFREEPKEGIESIRAKHSFGCSGESVSIMFVHVLLATALQVVLWDWLARLTWWPGPNCSVLAATAVAMLAVLLTFAAEGVQRASLGFGDISN